MEGFFFFYPLMISGLRVYSPDYPFIKNNTNKSSY